jgi:hypothetical protein
MLRLFGYQLCTTQPSVEYIQLSMLQITFDPKVGRNERPPRVGVNLIDVLAQVLPCTALAIEKLTPSSYPPKIVFFFCLRNMCIRGQGRASYGGFLSPPQ